LSASREKVLTDIRKSLGRGPVSGSVAAALRQRFEHPASNVIPARSRLDRVSRVNLFVTEAEKVDATTERLSTWDDIPAAIARYLKSANLPTTLRVATGTDMDAIPWSSEPLLSVATGPAEGNDAVGVTGVFGGVAETGTLVMLSGREHPTTLNFLPDTHIAVVSVDQIAGTYEEIWAKLRDSLGHGNMPRVVNWITGPSRTADIEQTLLLGAHGPLRLHILIIDA